MVKRILSFIGWVLAIFCLISALGNIGSGAVKIGIGILIWSLIFLPPLYRATGRYGLTKNIAARVVLFIFVPVVFAAPPQKTLTRPVPQLTPKETTQASTPTPTITVREAPTLTQTPEPINTPNIEPIPEPTEKILSPAPVIPPTAELTREPQNIPEKPTQKGEVQTIDPDTPVRAAVSGSRSVSIRYR